MRQIRCVALLSFLTSSAAWAGDEKEGSVKEDFRRIGHAFRDAAKDVGHATAKATHKVLRKTDEKVSGSKGKEEKTPGK